MIVAYTRYNNPIVVTFEKKKTYSIERTRSKKWRAGTRRNKHIHAK